MDPQHSSSSSSSSSSSNPNPSPSPSDTFCNHTGPNWAIHLLTDCACSMATNDTHHTHHLLYNLNELASYYGDPQQKLAAYFLRALLTHFTSSGPDTLQSLDSSSSPASFTSTVQTALTFQQLSPWSSFGHVASNSTILETFFPSSNRHCRRLHILDLSTTFCTQWPNFLEALATRSFELDYSSPPHLTITSILLSSSSNLSSTLVHDIQSRIKNFARLMGIPFKFNIQHHFGDPSTLNLHELIKSTYMDELAVNLVNSLRYIDPSQRKGFLETLRNLHPRIITVVEEEADFDREMTFLERFKESLRFFSTYFDSLEEIFKSRRMSWERLALEREAGRAMVEVVACHGGSERRERRKGWTERMRSAGMRRIEVSDEVEGDVRALVGRYEEDRWSVAPTMEEEKVGLVLKWKEEPVVWASVWKVEEE